MTMPPPPGAVRSAAPTLRILVSVLLLAPAAEAAGPSCDFHGDVPDQVRQAVDARPADFFEFRRGWKEKTRRARENRKRLARDPALLSRSGPDFRTAVAGSCFVPVFLAGFAGDTGGPQPRSGYDDMLNGPWATGSLREYYEEVSYGQLHVKATVYDWINVSEGSEYYAGSTSGIGDDARTGEFLVEIFEAQDAAVDFGQFDNDGDDGIPNSGDDDGYVDVVCIVQSRYDAAQRSCGDDSTFWSHKSVLEGWGDGEPFETNDPGAGGENIRISEYLICSAQDCNDVQQQIGLFAHELGHSLGIPDLYDKTETGGDCTTSKSEGIGRWGLMANGDKQSRSSPAHMCAWTKARLGWLVPGNVETSLPNWSIPSATTSPTAFKLWHGGLSADVDEYWLVEARSRQGFDKDILAPGILIWHVDESKYEGGDPNANECHPFLDLECADQTLPDHTLDHDDLAADLNRGDVGDVFCEGDTFTATTVPGAVSYSGLLTNVQVTVTECDTANHEFRADLTVGVASSTADLCIRDCGSDACVEPSECLRTWVSPFIYVDNDDDGTPDLPQEDAENSFRVVVNNVGAETVENVSVSLYYGAPAIGALIPFDLEFLGGDIIPVIGPFGEIVSEIRAVPPAPPANVDEYCYAAIVRSANDPVVGNDTARNRNNIAVLNAQEFWLPSGGPFAPFSSTRVTEVINHSAVSCSIVVFLEAPAAVIPPDWQFSISPANFRLPPGGRQPVEVQVSTTVPEHGDVIKLPLRARCVDTGEQIGGNILQWFLDDVAPSGPDQLSATIDLRGQPGDDDPLRDAVLVSWRDTNPDPDEIRAWEIYRGNPPYPPSPAFLVGTFAADEIADMADWQVFLDAEQDSLPVQYKIVAVDRAGNRSFPSATMQVVLKDDPVTTAPLSGLEPGVRLFPNPTRRGTAVAFTLDRPGPVAGEVFDLSGRRVRTIAARTMPAGRGTLGWDGRDEAGAPVASGIYMFRLHRPGAVSTHKVALTR